MIEEIIDQACMEKGIHNINQIKKKLLISSVGLNEGCVYLFSSIPPSRGECESIQYVTDIPIAKAVRASCSYPGIFSPCYHEGEVLVDGGIRENVPWKELKANGVDKVISIVFPKRVKYKSKKNIVDIICDSIDLMGKELANYELEGADYLLKIDTINTSLLDISKLKYFYQRGYEQTKKEILKIKKLIN